MITNLLHSYILGYLASTKLLLFTCGMHGYGFISRLRISTQTFTTLAQHFGQLWNPLPFLPMPILKPNSVFVHNTCCWITFQHFNCHSKLASRPRGPGCCRFSDSRERALADDPDHVDVGSVQFPAPGSPYERHVLTAWLDGLVSGLRAVHTWIGYSGEWFTRGWDRILEGNVGQKPSQKRPNTRHRPVGRMRCSAGNSSDERVTCESLVTTLGPSPYGYFRPCKFCIRVWRMKNTHEYCQSSIQGHTRLKSFVQDEPTTLNKIITSVVFH